MIARKISDVWRFREPTIRPSDVDCDEKTVTTHSNCTVSGFGMMVEDRRLAPIDVDGDVGRWTNKRILMTMAAVISTTLLML